MPSGQPGTGIFAGRKRDRFEPPRRRGRLSEAELVMIRALAFDQPSAASEAALERQIDRLARVLRRSPYAVRRALQSQRAVGKEKDRVLATVLRLKKPLEFVEALLSQSVGK